MKILLYFLIALCLGLYEINIAIKYVKSREYKSEALVRMFAVMVVVGCINPPLSWFIANLLIGE